MKKVTTSIVASVLLITIAQAEEKLKEVVITAKSQSDMLDTAGSYTIISKEEIAASNATSLKDILVDSVGVSEGVNSNSIYGRSAINIRGTESKHALILIDGKRISASAALIGHSDFEYNWLPLNAIEKIEIVRGPMSALYGSQAIGGVVNIITKKPQESLSGNIGTKVGKSSGDGGDQKELSLSLAGKLTPKLSASVFAQTKELTPLKEGSATTAKKEGKKIKDGMLNVWYDIDDTQQLTASAIKGNEIRDNIEYDEFYDIDKQHYALGYEKRFDKVKANLKYYTSSMDAYTEQFLYTHKLKDEVISGELAIASLNKNYIVLGAENRKEKYHKVYDTPTTTKTNYQAEIDYRSFYAQDEIEITDKLLTTFGARYDKHENFGSEISPKAAVVYKLNENNRLKAGYGHGFNAPSLTQGSDAYSASIPITFTPPMEFNRFHGNSNLNPEISDSFEAGYEYSKEKDSFKITAFHTKIKDLITTKDNGRTTITPPRGPMITYNEILYSNVNSATIDGLEISLNKTQIVSNLDMGLSYTALDTKDESTQEELTLRPKHKVNLRLSSILPFEIQSNLSVNYIGSQYTTTYIESSDEIKRINLNGYATANLQFSKEMAKNLTLKVGADNITDKKLGDDYDFLLDNRVVYAALDYKF